VRHLEWQALEGKGYIVKFKQGALEKAVIEANTFRAKRSNYMVSIIVCWSLSIPRDDRQVALLLKLRACVVTLPTVLRNEVMIAGSN